MKALLVKIGNKEIDLAEWHRAGNKTKVDYHEELDELWFAAKYKNLRKATTYKFLYYDPK